MALLWCEARCGIMNTNAGCLETSKGTFGARNASAYVRRQGWRIIEDEWVCPVCAALPPAPTTGDTHD